MKYETLEEALKDVETARKRPSDSVFLKNMSEKVKNSSEEIQKNFQDFLEEYLFECHPRRLVTLLKKRHKGYFVLNKKNLFFEA